MTEQAQDFTNQAIPRGNPRCLHCAVRFMVAVWIQRNCERAEDGTPKMSIKAIVMNLSMVIAGFVEAIPAGPTRDQTKLFSIMALDRCLSDPASADLGTRH